MLCFFPTFNEEKEKNQRHKSLNYYFVNIFFLRYCRLFNNAKPVKTVVPKIKIIKSKTGKISVVNVRKVFVTE